MKIDFWRCIRIAALAIFLSLGVFFDSRADFYEITKEDKEFLAQIKMAVAKNDKAWLADNISFPIVPMIDSHPRRIKTKDDFLKYYDQIFSDLVRSAVAKQIPENLFKKDTGVMIGNGELWFTQSYDQLPGKKLHFPKGKPELVDMQTGQITEPKLFYVIESINNISIPDQEKIMKERYPLEEARLGSIPEKVILELPPEWRGYWTIGDDAGELPIRESDDGDAPSFMGKRLALGDISSTSSDVACLPGSYKIGATSLTDFERDWRIGEAYFEVMGIQKGPIQELTVICGDRPWVIMRPKAGSTLLFRNGHFFSTEQQTQ